MASNAHRKVIDQVFILLGCVTVVVLVIVGGLAWYASSFAKSSVRDELVAQKIYFPNAGDPSFSASEYPTLQKYAGQQVDDGLKAKAFADDFIGHHLQKVAGGKTYSEVSALALKDPTNQQLQQQKATLFQGETLRGMLLGDGYAFWMFGQIAFYASLAAFAGAAGMVILVLLGWRHMDKL